MVISILYLSFGCSFQNQTSFLADKNLRCGDEIGQLEGVSIYYNDGFSSCETGRHWSVDKYSYGMKWQCVEFVRRFYKDFFEHEMPNRYGNAIDYFNPKIKAGSINQDRGLVQFYNGSTEKPEVYDLLVCNMPPIYGHVAIISEVGKNYIVIAQQNSSSPFVRLPLNEENGNWHIQSSCIGFLRIPDEI